MRQTVYSILIWAWSITLGCAQSPEAFTPKAFHVEVKDMFPLSYGASYGLNDFSLTLRNDSALVCMPYLGEAYVPSFNYDGLRFEHLYDKLKVSKDKKGEATIVTFNVKHGIVDHRFTITAYPNHKAYITVFPSNAQACSYAGEWTAVEQRQLSYVALVLDELSSNTLKAFANNNMPWNDNTVYCHHMTIAHHTNITPKLQRWAERHKGKSYTIQATEYGHSDKAFAVKVNNKKVPSINRMPHVTLATNNAAGGKAVESNYITAWQPLSSPITLTGTITFIYQ
ncbi:MAG: DUF4251 domain-containing protein [Bacteroidaceae bacterium]|nr:DUF4251 domain-containing protein [Bacteroidaceae bacterium]